MKMITLLTSCLLLLTTYSSMARQATDRATQQMDSLFAAYNTTTPGVAIAVVKDGQTIFQKGYGTANLEYGIPITPSTVFQSASVSKQFTAFAIYLLEKQGKISMEDDIRRYFPELPDYEKPVRIRHLLAHTGGIKDEWAFLTIAGWQEEDVITTDQILRLLARQKELNFTPGTTFGYSNTGYTLLAELIHRVSGLSFSAYTKKYIFEPLGMVNTQFYDDYHKIIKNRAYSYEKANGVYERRELIFSNVGPTSLYTTAEDMTRWAANFTTPKVGDAALIKAFNTISLLDNNKPVIYAISANDTLYHSKGQVSWRYRGLNVYSHGGHVAGYRAWLFRVPEQNFAIVALSNDEHYDILNTGKQIVGFYLKDKLNEAPGNTADAATPLKDTTADYKTNLNELAGEYYSEELDTKYKIAVSNDTLTMHHTRLKDIVLNRKGEYAFSGINTFPFDIAFIKDGKAITAFSISNFGVKNVRFTRIGGGTFKRTASNTSAKK
ncbi:serine hydrolase domain-containing protein [Chitinophaga rhizophila]|uniref:Beta-lactamase family protein n=1 Tax=Chitinophaga rhizophila TaxID=2866212 RepID=A0ABS7GB59_9BACT|nr:serine hydrolase domain-containing protein [Chitinophaga rhizophila]MBW8684495.1 beta-lactamase family protein [Chitinophaga rhizophila]